MQSNARNLHPSAGFWRRLASICYDLLLVAALFMLVAGLVILIRGGAAVDPGSIWFQLLLLAVWWTYFAGSWIRGGQTIGMRAWRLVLTELDGRPVGIRAACLRFAGAWVSAAALGLGFLACLVDPEGRGWHDRISGTRLGHRPKSAQANHRNEGEPQ